MRKHFQYVNAEHIAAHNFAKIENYSQTNKHSSERYCLNKLCFNTILDISFLFLSVSSLDNLFPTVRGGLCTSPESSLDRDSAGEQLKLSNPFIPGSLLPGKSARIDEKEPLSFHYCAYKKSVTARFLKLLRFFLQESPLNLPAPIFDCRNQCDRHGQRRQPGKYKTYYTNFSSFLIRSILSFSSARTFS